MDKDAFLKLAPEYYMLALCIHFDYPRDFHGESSFIRDFSVEYDGEYHDIVENVALRREALRRSETLGAIKTVPDPFGPILWHKGPNFEKLQDELEKTPSSVFYKARMSGDRREWLIDALPKVNGRAQDMNVTGEDFLIDEVSQFTAAFYRPDPAPEPVDEWSPIKLDPTDPVVADAADKLAAATQAIEQDNGYAAERTQERDAVLTDLKGGLEKIKSGEVSVGWVRRTVDALKIASVTFANNVKSQVIDGAMQALKEVVKVHMKDAVETLFRHWSF